MGGGPAEPRPPRPPPSSTREGQRDDEAAAGEGMPVETVGERSERIQRERAERIQGRRGGA